MSKKQKCQHLTLQPTCVCLSMMVIAAMNFASWPDTSDGIVYSFLKISHPILWIQSRLKKRNFITFLTIGKVKCLEKCTSFWLQLSCKLHCKKRNGKGGTNLSIFNLWTIAAALLVKRENFCKVNTSFEIVMWYYSHLIGGVKHYWRKDYFDGRF